MLDILRQGAQSWGIKILFGIIIAVFVLAFGMDRAQNNSGNVIGTVNETPILVANYQERLQRNIDMARNQNPSLTPEMLAQLGIKKQVFDQMVTEELLMQKATALGLSVSKEELANEIHLIPAFHNEAKIFDPEVYKNVLRNNNLNPGTFESDFLRGMLIDKLTSYISVNGKLTEEQIRDVHNYARTKATVAHLMYPWADYKNQVNATEEQILKYYEDNKNQYVIPAQAKIAYIVLHPSTLADYNAVSSQEIEDYYHKNKEQFKVEEQVSARHLLVRVDENATDADIAKANEKIAKAQSELKAGKSFEEVAGKYTEDPSGTQSGGNLGWFTRGKMVPPFEEAAFSTEPGKVSEPVRTQFGFHLIKVEDKKNEGYEEYKDAIPAILDTIAKDRASEKIQDYLDQALEVIIAGGDVYEVAKSIGLKVTAKETDFFTRDRGPAEFDGISSDNVSMLFDLAANATTQTPIQIKDGYVLATKIDIKDASTRPLEEVRESIADVITREEALKVAKAEADKDAVRLAAHEEVVKEKNATLTESEPFGRQDAIPGLGMNQLASTAVFNATAETWLPESYAFQDGYALIKALKMTPPTNEQWEQEKETWLSSLNQRSEQQLVQAFIAELRGKADIKIVNQAILAN